MMDIARWQDRRVLVTGASGIVGSWLCIALEGAGAHVHALIRDVVPRSYLHTSGVADRIAKVFGELEDARLLERAIVEYDIDTVFHLGAQTIVGTALESPAATLRANVAGTWNLLEAVRLHGRMVKAVVVASSDKAYGDHGGIPYTETLPLRGLHPYDVSKSCADLIAQAYAHTYGLPVAIARCANVYGGGDFNWDRLVPGTIRAALAGRRPEIRSDGRYVREYLYVQDVVDAYLRLAENIDTDQVRGQAFNFGTSQPLPVLEVVGGILDAVGRPDLEPVVRNAAQHEIRAQTIDWARARSILGWLPHHELRDGLSATVAWYRTYLAGGRP